MNKVDVTYPWDVIETTNFAMNRQTLMWTEKSIERVTLRTITYLSIAQRSPTDVLTIKHDFPRGRTCFRGKHTKSRTLTGTVDPQETETCTGFNTNAQVLHSHVRTVHASVFFSQTHRFYHVPVTNVLDSDSLPHYVFVLVYGLVPNSGIIKRHNLIPYSFFIRIGRKR